MLIHFKIVKIMYGHFRKFGKVQKSIKERKNHSYSHQLEITIFWYFSCHIFMSKKSIYKYLNVNSEIRCLHIYKVGVTLGVLILIQHYIVNISQLSLNGLQKHFSDCTIFYYIDGSHFISLQLCFLCINVWAHKFQLAQDSQQGIYKNPYLYKLFDSL